MIHRAQNINKFKERSDYINIKPFKEVTPSYNHLYEINNQLNNQMDRNDRSESRLWEKIRTLNKKIDTMGHTICCMADN